MRSDAPELWSSFKYLANSCAIIRQNGFVPDFKRILFSNITKVFGGCMEDLCDLLFELSNEDRLKILYELKKNPQKLSHLASLLNFTVQGTTRNISRLNKAGLVERDTDSNYRITSYGRYVIELLPGFDFLSNHKEYFETHTLDFLPHEFLLRIGDLSSCTYTGDTLTTFYTGYKMMQESEEYFWTISDQFMISALPHLISAIERGVKLRLLMPSSQVYPKDYFKQDIVKESNKVFDYGKENGLFEERWLDQIDIPLGITEKHYGGRIIFQRRDGTFDYRGLSIVDERSHQFVKDLFLYYWKKGSNKTPEHILTSIAKA